MDVRPLGGGRGLSRVTTGGGFWGGGGVNCYYPPGFVKWKEGGFFTSGGGVS